MNSTIAIRADNVGKKFSKTLKQMMMYGARDIVAGSLGFDTAPGKLRPGEFWAVDGVSFQLRRGASLGIIGPNGSGKTTLLRMINGIFMPDSGFVEVHGRVGGLIHVGAGFHPMLTGRENVYVNGAILGMTKKEIDRKFSAIVEFADIGEFLDSPVKQYSSGMYVRLGFAVAVHSDPDILLVDEVLAVGDRDFSLKCYQKMKEIRDRGTTLVLVSHNEYVIRERTEQCLYLKNGRPRAFGPSEEMISLYIRDGLEAKAAQAAHSVQRGQDASRRLQIVEVAFLAANGTPLSGMVTGDALLVRVRMRVNGEVPAPFFSVNFYTDAGLVYAANSMYEGVRFPDLSAGEITVELLFPRLDLPTETYYVSVIAGEGEACYPLDTQHFAYTILVGRAPNARGLLKLPVEWKMEAAA